MNQLDRNTTAKLSCLLPKDHKDEHIRNFLCTWTKLRVQDENAVNDDGGLQVHRIM